MVDIESPRWLGRARELVAVFGIGFAFIGFFLFLPLLIKVSSLSDRVALIFAITICVAGVFGSIKLMVRHERSFALLMFWFAQLFIFITPILKYDLALFCMARVGFSLERFVFFADVAIGGWISYGVMSPVDSEGARIAFDLVPMAFLSLIFFVTVSDRKQQKTVLL